MTEGIYRKAGSNININKLLAEFRSNACAVQISREDYSEHDVANVLKRFIRQLEEPLLTQQLRDDFLAVAETADTITSEQQTADDKLENYRHLLAKLPAINYNTLRRLVSFITTNTIQSSHVPLTFSRLDISTSWLTNVTRI